MINLPISFALSSMNSEPLPDKSHSASETLPRVRQSWYFARAVALEFAYLGKVFSESNTAPDPRASYAMFSSMLTAFSVTQDMARRLVPSAEAPRAKCEGRRECKGKGKE